MKRDARGRRDVQTCYSHISKLVSFLMDHNSCQQLVISKDRESVIAIYGTVQVTALIYMYLLGVTCSRTSTSC